MAFNQIYHEERLRFGLSCNEYCVADSICYLSYNKSNTSGWCYASRAYLGEILGLTKQAILNIIDKLVKCELVEIHVENKHLRPTENWYKYFTDGKENLPESNSNQNDVAVKKLYRNGKNSLPVSGKDSLPYIDSLKLKEKIIELKKENEISKKEISSLRFENEQIKSELEKANETIKTLEEKEKKEKSSAKKESLVYNFPDDFSEEVKMKFVGFVENRKAIKKPVKTQLTLDELIESLVPFDNIDRLMAIKHSVASGWMGLFPKKTNNSSLVYHNHNKNGTASTIPSSTNKANWSAEKTALDALAISKARFAEQG